MRSYLSAGHGMQMQVKGEIRLANVYNIFALMLGLLSVLAAFIVSLTITQLSAVGPR